MARTTKEDSGFKKADAFDSAITAVADKLMEKARPSTDDLFRMAEQENVNPFKILLQIADGNKAALDLDDEDDKPISPELRAMAARECLKYLYPTMKATEITGKDGAPLEMPAIKVIFEGPEPSNVEE